MKKVFLLCCLLLSFGSRAQNPIVPMGVYIADPTSRVMLDGRLYIYGSTDITPGEYCSKDYHVFSTADLTGKWTFHRNSFSWEEILYAPDVMLRDKTYYLYFDTPNGNEYVATSDSPVGPFGNAVQIEGPRQIDPSIFIDDDGQAYYFWGQISAKGAKMNPDMKTLDLSTMVDGLVTEKGHHFHEGSYVIKRGKYYYFIYADISRNRRPTCLGYAMATHPLGPYEYKGIIIDNSGCDPSSWNNHGSLVEFKGQWYVLYHRSTHNCRAMRKTCIEPIRFNADGTINEVEMTTQGAAGPLSVFQPMDAARACLLRGKTYIRRTEGNNSTEELGNIHSGDAAAWKYLDFGKGAKSVSVNLKSLAGGQIVLHADSPDGPRLGSIDVPPHTEWNTLSTHIEKTAGVHALWMEFLTNNPAGSDEELFCIRSFSFSKKRR